MYEVFLIDGRVVGYQALIDILPVGVVWSVLDSNSDGLTQVAGLLSGCVDIT